MPTLQAARRTDMKNSIIIGFFTTLCAAASAFAQSVPSPYLSGFRYIDGGLLAGTISPAPSGQSNFLATRNTYDANGRLQKVETGVLASWQAESTLPKDWSGFTVKKTVTYTFDASGNKTTETVTGNNGTATLTNLTQYSYDAYDRVTCTAVRMNPSAFSTLPASACSLGTQGSDGPDRISSNAYDALDRVIQTRRAVATSVEQAYVTFSYNADGLKQDIVDANGNHTLLTYDGLDRQSAMYFPSKTQPLSFNPASQATALASAGAYNSGDYESYSYDKNGNRTSLKKRDGQLIGYQYDAMNRLTFKDVPGSTGDVTYTYDLRGLQTSALFPSGTGVSNSYDGFGRNSSSTITMGGVSRSIGRLFDSEGNRTRVTHPDSNYFVYSYDGLNRLSGILENGATSIVSQAYYSFGPTYTQTRTGVSTTYSYDVALRLSSWADDLAGTTSDVTTSFTAYNAANQVLNRSRDNDNYKYTGYTSGNYDYGRNGLNQYTSVGGSTLSYDANGNLTSDGVTTFQYDAENRLVSASGSKNATLTYDPLGRLFQIVSGNVTTQFLYDGDELVAEFNGSGTLLQRYVHGPHDDDPLIWYEGGTVSAAARRSLQSDYQGSIASIADSAGNSRSINRYDEYGIPDPNNAGRFGYTGQLWLPELALNYYKARFYNPRIGRFLQTDPIGYKEDFNLYTYVGDDPTNDTDPSGECPMCIGALIGALVDAGVQVATNMASGQGFGEAVSNIDLKSVAVSAALGAVGSLGGASAARVAAKGLSNAAKGNIGEAVTRVGILLRGEKMIARGEKASKVAELGKVTGRAANAKPDFVVRTLTGKIKVIESKFGTAQLSRAQKALEKTLGDTFSVSRTTADEIGAVAGGTATTVSAAAVGAVSGDCPGNGAGVCK